MNPVMRGSFFIALFALVGCGGGKVSFVQPADNQVYTATQGQPCLQFIAADNDTNVAIEFRGKESVQSFLTCTDAPSGGVAQCCPAYSNTGGFGGQCTSQAPCLLVAIGTKNGNQGIVTVRVVQSGR